jgi:hypothetical protein
VTWKFAVSEAQSPFRVAVPEQMPILTGNTCVKNGVYLIDTVTLLRSKRWNEDCKSHRCTSWEP